MLLRIIFYIFEYQILYINLFHSISPYLKYPAHYWFFLNINLIKKMGLASSKRMCIVGFLILLFFLQSCTVYQKTPVSINEAITLDKKVLVITDSDKKLKFKKIEQINGIYYGITKTAIRVPLIESKIKTIRISDKSKSTLLTIGVVVVPLAIVVIFSIIDWGPGNIGWGEQF